MLCIFYPSIWLDRAVQVEIWGRKVRLMLSLDFLIFFSVCPCTSSGINLYYKWPPHIFFGIGKSINSISQALISNRHLTLQVWVLFCKGRGNYQISLFSHLPFILHLCPLFLESYKRYVRDWLTAYTCFSWGLHGESEF